MTASSPNVVAQSAFGPIIINMQDRFVSRSIINGSFWDHENIVLLARLARARLKSKPRLRFHDIGANIGTHSLALARFLGAAVDIRAFEAQPAIFNMLCGTLALNNLHNVSVHMNAVADADGRIIRVALPDYNAPNNFGGLELIPPVASDNSDMQMSGRYCEVRTVSVDSFNESVDLIKLDIEGMELLALHGAARTIEASRPIVAVEMTKSDGAAIRAFFAARDYDVHDSGTDSFFLPKEMKMRIQASAQAPA